MKVYKTATKNGYKNIISGPHQQQHIVRFGSLEEDAKAAIIMIHPRGSTAQDILSLAHEINVPELSFIAPQAKNNTWYPYSFLSPLSQNEPYLSSALAVIDSVVEMLIQKGLNSQNIYLLGFSQGACLGLEYAARNPQKYGGVFGLSGGLIGDVLDFSNYAGDFEETEIFLGCSDVDPYIPLSRINETEEILKKLGANVTRRIYKDMTHTITYDEIEFINSTIKRGTNK